jgi:hypothetical protein
MSKSNVHAVRSAALARLARCMGQKERTGGNDG